MTKRSKIRTNIKDVEPGILTFESLNKAFEDARNEPVRLHYTPLSAQLVDYMLEEGASPESILNGFYMISTTSYEKLKRLLAQQKEKQ